MKQEWISVNDRMPSPGANVDVVTPCRTLNAVYCGNGKFYAHIGNSDFMEELTGGYRVTHWCKETINGDRH